MLAVLKKRWKPKRAGGVNNLQHNINNNNNNNNGVGVGRRAVKSAVIEPSSDKEKLSPRISTSPRQVHPVGEMVVVSPVPNICVQGGRIEFIRPGETSPGGNLDPVKEKLEARIAELEAQLEDEKKSTLKERRNTAHYQALLQERECLSRDVEVERGSREEAEARLQITEKEAASSKIRIQNLQASVNRLEESLRAMSLYKTKYSQLKLENTSLRNALESRMQCFESMLSRLSQENILLKAHLKSLEETGMYEEKLSVKLKEVEEENQRLLKERYQCEKCLDQVANHIVKALLSQKSLREEIVTLRDRVKELETQNRALSSILIQQIPSPSKQTPVKSSQPACLGRPVSCDESKLRWSESFLWLPIDRPRSLNLESAQPSTPKPCTPPGGDAHKDEGYSTMSSEAQVESAPGATQSGLERLQEESEQRTISSQTEGCRWSLVRSASDSQLSSQIMTSSGPAPAQTDWWDMDWVHAHWLRLDDTRCLLQHHIDLCPIDIEEWTMDDITPGMSGESEADETWAGWSESSKRSSTASSEQDAAPSTDFTSDFYRLVKFESTRSLASSSGPPTICQVEESAETNLPAPVLEEVTDLLQPVNKLLDPCEDPEKPSSIRSLLTVPEEEEELVAGASLTSSISTPDTVVPPVRPVDAIDEVKATEVNETSVHTVECNEYIINEGQDCNGAEGGMEDPLAVLEDPPPWSSHQLLAELARLSDAETSDDVSPDDTQDDLAACPTSWVRVNSSVDFGDPKARANIIDVMMSNRSSSSCSGSSDSSEDHQDYQHLHRIHRSRRHKKASANRDGVGALRRIGQQRVSIIGRDDLFSRFGAKEEEAIASFDFLEEFSTTSSNESTACRP